MMNNKNILDILDERYKILPNGEIYGVLDNKMQFILIQQDYKKQKKFINMT